MDGLTCRGWLALLLVAGCGDLADAPDAGGGPRDSGEGARSMLEEDAAVDAGSAATSETYSVEWGPVVAQPGEEDTRCVVKRLSNEGPILVNELVNDLGGFSHHLILYRTADTEERPEPFPCDPFTDTLDPTQGSPLAVTQRREEQIQLPRGVAYTLEPNQMIRIELHYINYSSEPAELRASTTFRTISEAEFEHEADFLFIGNPDVDLAPRETTVLGPTYLELPGELDGVNFFSITGHTHQWGTNVLVDVVDDSEAEGQAVYDVPSWDWDEPATIYHDPPFRVPEGGGFRFTCEYDNLSDSRVGFGESADDEMCFFWAYYYPSQGSRVCIKSDQFGVEACCPGHPLCGAILGAL